MNWIWTYLKPFKARIARGLTIKVIGTITELLNADTSGTGDDHFVRGDAEPHGGKFSRPLSIGKPGTSGTGIGVAAVDDGSTDKGRIQNPAFAKLDGSRRKSATGECSGKVTGVFRKNHGEVRGSAALETGGHTGGKKSRSRGHGTIFDPLKIAHSMGSP